MKLGIPPNIKEAIDAGDIAKLLRIADGRCACMGPKNGEPKCPCKMKRYQQVQDIVSLAALKRGRIVILNRGQ